MILAVLGTLKIASNQDKWARDAELSPEPYTAKYLTVMQPSLKAWCFHQQPEMAPEHKTIR